MRLSCSQLLSQPSHIFIRSTPSLSLDFLNSTELIFRMKFQSGGLIYIINCF